MANEFGEYCPLTGRMLEDDGVRLTPQEIIARVKEERKKREKREKQQRQERREKLGI